MRAFRAIRPKINEGGPPYAQATRCRGRRGPGGESLQLPEHVQLSLGEIAGQAKDGLLALAVSTGLAVLHETMEWEVERVVGPKGRHDRERTAKRHGHTPGEVTLGGRRVPISRPRVRTADDTEEIGLDSYQEFASRDLLEQVALEPMLAGVSTRRSRRVEEPVGEDVRESARSTSKSAVSRSFVARTRTALEELLGRDLSDLELAVMMIDGVDLADVTHVVALGITVDGTKVPLSLREGRPRTRPSRPRCCLTWSSAAWIPSRECCS